MFILVAGGLLLMEVLDAVALQGLRTDANRQEAHRGPATLGLAASVLAGPGPKVFRKRALMLMTVSGVIALVALIV